MQPASPASAGFERVYDWVKHRKPEVKTQAFIDAITQHPDWLAMHTLTHRWTMAHQLVSMGDVALLKQAMAAIAPHLFKFQIVTRNEKPPRTLVDVVPAQMAEMRAFILELYEHDRLCHAAKWRFDVEFDWILQTSVAHPTWAFTPGVSRSWSPAMQLVFKASSANVKTFFDRVKRSPDIWSKRYDGLSLLDIALRNVMLRPIVVHILYTVLHADGVVLNLSAALPSAANGATWTLARVEDLWNAVNPLPVGRGKGICVICSTTNLDLFSVSINCGTHSYCGDCIKAWMDNALGSGPFPLRCPGCSVGATAALTERGIVTRSAIRGLGHLAAPLAADVQLLKRVLLQQLLHIPDEASTDLVYRTSKPCPKCSMSITHYFGHGCHHIRPGSGCPGCGTHFCYVCLRLWPKACPCPMACAQGVNCGCPPCPDCQPLAPCANCEGCPACA